MFVVLGHGKRTSLELDAAIGRFLEHLVRTAKQPTAEAGAGTALLEVRYATVLNNQLACAVLYGTLKRPGNALRQSPEHGPVRQQGAYV